MENAIVNWLTRWKRTIIQFFKFQAASVIAWLVDYGVYNLIFIFIFNSAKNTDIWSVMISYIAGVLTSYLVNKRWTFGVKRQIISHYLVKFFIVNIFAITAKVCGMYILTEYYNLSPFITPLLTTVFSFCINYCGNKLWVFEGK